MIRSRVAEQPSPAKQSAQLMKCIAISPSCRLQCKLQRKR